MFEAVCPQFNAELIEFDGEKEHVHLSVLNLSQLSITELIFRLKKHLLYYP
ncbi:transposase [uncultured Succinatimonas sp.]|uniref:transposase n=1 Tax=uncultured Succinatimonas sp. TaxID=1262973 RepID=UPI003459A42C